MSEGKKECRKQCLAELSAIVVGEASVAFDVDFKENDELCFGDALFNGEAPTRTLLFGDGAATKRIEGFNIVESNPTNWFDIKVNLRRETPVLQDPAETFSKMNAIMHQTLKYVKEVESIDFNSLDIMDFDGEIMKDPLRVFLSVCTSVLANFSFCSPLDMGKLLNFLSDLFKNYSSDNAYHNALHAADSVQMMFLILREKPASLIFTDDEMIVAFLATLCVSLVHPGVTNNFLARIDHPLTLVYGDMTTQQSASLTTFIYLLKREENRFIDLSAGGGLQPVSQFLRELLIETVLRSAPRARASLFQALQVVAVSNKVSLKDVPVLLTSMIILADNALAFRPRKQFLNSARLLCGEWLREVYEEERRRMGPILPNLSSRIGDHGLTMVVNYTKVWVSPLASAIHALVPQDLFDNMERNGDAPKLSEQSEFDLSWVSPEERWNDGSLPVVDIFRKITTHATSLDRKASKKAILNAASTRKVSICSSEVFSPCSYDEKNGILFSFDKTTDQQPSRCEHYFSFLRLYDTYEREGRPAAEFATQLVFLALQLNPKYIGCYARQNVDINSKEQCDVIARLIMDEEEAPSTAEVIASPSHNGQRTDGFLLRLMEMYRERDEKKSSSSVTNCSANISLNSRHPLQCNNPVYGAVARGKKV